jgi:hypothetical protein
MYWRTIIALIVGIALLSLSPGGAAALTETPAGQLRVTLDRLLSEHAFLTVQAMHAGVTDDDVFAAAAEALESNTTELEEAVAGIYGEEAGRSFGDLWRTHIGFVVDYTRAHRADDDAAKERAQQGLESFQEDFTAFLSGANPELSEEVLRSLLEDHLGQLQHVAHLQEGDYKAVYEAASDAHQHMFALGDGLSEAIATQLPETFTGRGFAFGPAMDLRVALDQLLGEHAFLAAEVMRMAEAGSDAESAAAEALAANGESIRAAIADIYGAEAAAGFAEVWEQHNGHYVDYVRATQGGDDAATARARAGLEDFSDEVADFFVAATDLSDGDAVRAGLRAHTEHLVEQVDAYASGDYTTAFVIAREAYRHMGGISDLLATGIANQFPERFLPDTAVDSPAALPGLSWLALCLLAVGGAGLVVAQRLTAGPRSSRRR